MSVWPNSCLEGQDGELFSVTISVAPRELEALLEALSSISFPVNPRIHHAAMTTVDFPAYAAGLPEVRRVVAGAGFDPESIRVTAMLELLAAG